MVLSNIRTATLWCGLDTEKMNVIASHCYIEGPYAVISKLTVLDSPLVSRAIHTEARLRCSLATVRFIHTKAPAPPPLLSI
jgi:hypothetical protein